MEISNIYKKLRNPILNPLKCILYSFRSISISSVTYSSSPSQGITLRYSRCPVRILSRSSSISSSDTSSSSMSPETRVFREKSDFEESNRGVSDKTQFSRRNFKCKVSYRKPNVNPENIAEILELIKRENDDMESRLNRMNLSFSLASISEIFRVLNFDGVSGLRFFNWVRETQPDFNRNSEFCSLVIDNLGRVEDYESMLLLLNDLSRKGICLTENAFAFVPVCSSDGASVWGSVKRVIEILNMAGGSCRNSGIYALIKMLCTLNSFDLAIFVMEETMRKTSYYNVLIWAKCRTRNFQEAHDMFDEMRRFGCDPNANSYNYLLSSLCKNGRTAEAGNLLGIMQESGYLPDAVTFEVIVHHSCKLGRLDFAVEFLNQMISRGLEPRLTTHAAFIKGYFYSNRFQEAYKYVVDMGVKYKCSSNMNYSLLASLHQRKGKLIEAREILVDMIEKGHKPNFPIYMKVMKDLHKSGMGDLVTDLKNRFSKFHSSTDAG